VDDETASETDGRRERVLRSAALFYAGLTILALVIGVITDNSLLWRRRPEQILDVAFQFGLGLGLGAAIILASSLLTRASNWGKSFEAMVQELFGPLAWSDCFFLALLSSLGEELFFRGALQPLLGLYPTSLLFALAHWPRSRELLPWTIMAGMLGLGFGYWTEASGQLAAPIAAHFLVNFVNLRLITKKAS
jgi:membrane protease YdiL (CAAX protease family)